MTAFNPLSVRSVSGPAFTIIDGGRSNQCASLGNETSLTGFTLKNGYGGGASGGTLSNCVLSGNLGGGALNCRLNNCALTGNTVYGAWASALNNCTLTGNDSGAFDSFLTNCIAYFNTSGNYSSCTLNYCCTTPLPTSGVGNISSDPQLASASHLSASSPCRGVGNGAWVSGTDIDGESWVNPPSMGCDEYHAGAVTGPLSVAISVSSTNVAVGYAVALTAQINGRTDLSVWDFGDGALEINQPYTAHSWSALGDYTVSLWAFSDSYPSGTNGTVIIHVVGPHYVEASSPNPTAPYSSWATAARNIQDAIAAATEAGTVVVLVTNGTYAPIMAYYPASLSVRSVNGALFTVIEGGHSNRCVTLAAGVSLSGFTLADGVASFGGGAWGGTLNNCILVRNVTSNSYPGDGVGGGAFNCTLNNCTLSGNSGGSGGGAFDCTLNNCTLSGNSAYDSGGGASASVLNNCNLSGNSAWVGGGASYGYHFGSYSRCFLNNCTLSGNSAKVGGGAYVSVLNNCTLTGNSASGYNGNGCGGVYGSVLNNSILYFNTAPNDANFHQDQYTVLNSCCTTPQPTNGVGNITNAPLFVDQASGNLRLQSNSPCINAGNNSYVTGATDLDGNPRIAGGTVDIGAYEYQTPTSIISYAWLQQYGLPTDGSADFADPDHDGLNNWQEWRCGTDPTNALSALRLLRPVKTGTNATVSWQSVAGVNYFLERSTNLSGPAGFTWLATNISGQPGTTSYSDTNTIGTVPRFYRVGVGVP